MLVLFDGFLCNLLHMDVLLSTTVLLELLCVGCFQAVDGSSFFINCLTFSCISSSVGGSIFTPNMVAIIFILGVLLSVCLWDYLRAMVCIHHMPKHGASSGATSSLSSMSSIFSCVSPYASSL